MTHQLWSLVLGCSRPFVKSYWPFHFSRNMLELVSDFVAFTVDVPQSRRFLRQGAHLFLAGQSIFVSSATLPLTFEAFLSFSPKHDLNPHPTGKSSVLVSVSQSKPVPSSDSRRHNLGMGKDTDPLFLQFYCVPSQTPQAASCLVMCQVSAVLILY